MADSSHGYGDLVEVRLADGTRVIGRVHAGSVSPRGRLLNQLLFVPESSYQRDVSLNPAFDVYDIPEFSPDWGVVPPKPWLVVPSYMVESALTEGMKEYFRRQGLCPKCGDPGYWQNMACICKHHGPFLGV